MSGIEWTDETWNPTGGCDRVSPGCDNCYALGMAKRLKAMGSAGYQNDGDPVTSGPGFKLTLHPERLEMPLRWRKPRKIFVNSMSDLFHKDVPFLFIARVFAVMSLAPQHTFQILTKRHARLRSVLRDPEFEERVREIAREMKYSEGRSNPRMNDQNYQKWPLPNVHLGVSVEDQQWADIRIPALLDTPAAVRWISAEPLLGPVDLSAWLADQTWPQCWNDHGPGDECGRCIRPEWVVVGGESGPGARPMHPEWARQLRDQCAVAEVPFLFKQHGSWVAPDQMPDDTFQRWEAHHAGEDQTRPVHVGKRAAGRLLDERTHDGYPAS